MIKGALDNILEFFFLAKFHLSGKIDSYWLLIYKYKKKNSKFQKISKIQKVKKS